MGFEPAVRLPVQRFSSWQVLMLALLTGFIPLPLQTLQYDAISRLRAAASYLTLPNPSTALPAFESALSVSHRTRM